MKAALFVLALLAAMAVVILGCNFGSATIVACTDIPDGGCPQDNGATVCDDPTCQRVYACVSGAWVLSQSCPARPQEAAAPEDAGAEASPGLDASFDAPLDALPPGANGGPGCVDLQLPDCSLGSALACASSPDCCGCEALFVCQGGGWTVWGTCGDGGIVKH